MKGGQLNKCTTTDASKAKKGIPIWNRGSTAVDRYARWSHLYRKEAIEVQLDGEIVQTMVYIMNEGKPLNQPSDYYYSVILDGYKSAGFDVEKLKKAVADSFEE